jgi:sulfur-carrier protein
MKVTVRYFASLREALGSNEVMTLEGATTVAVLRDALIARGGRHAQALQRGKAVRCAVDQAMVDESVSLRDGVEVAFFPPVTGG